MLVLFMLILTSARIRLFSVRSLPVASAAPSNNSTLFREAQSHGNRYVPMRLLGLGLSGTGEL